MTPTFVNIVDRYIKSEIPYALFIDGKWGSGKTWYLKNLPLKQNSPQH